MIDHVDRTLKLWRSTLFAYGSTDCMMSIGSYVATRGALDVTGLFRGTYADEAGARRHIAAYGGIEGIFALFGLDPIERPTRGDVAALWTGSEAVGALCTGQGYAARLERGVIEVDRRLVKIVGGWKVP